ncbi:MAG TPA: NAD(P)H-dependent glycerol-3-phosphate dehydrogenase [Dehalococcoidia bacterium]|nr:NAD(P)H-dependent glycerol-3-phosphate dehydrogenase [Dehalococcoidia bacterium]
METSASGRVAVVGTGAWGTALATLFVQAGAETVLLCRDATEAAELGICRENRRFLPGVPLPASLCFAGEPAEALLGAGLVVLAVPAQRLRENLRWIGAALDPRADLLCASKGIELSSGLRMSEVVRDALGERTGACLTLSGPNLSGEIVRGLPAASVVAGPPAQAAAARAVQQRISSERFRLYTSTDQVGVEIGGAMKNVVAIACGICDGLGYGHNARAGLTTRGLAEMTRLARACGGRTRTLAGLAGLGDLVATVASSSSRNYALGLALGRGESLAAITAGSVHVAEGVQTAQAALTLAARLGVELPVTQQLAAVLSGHCTPVDGARALMRRALVAE